MLTCALIHLLVSVGIDSDPQNVDETKVKELISRLGHFRFAVRAKAEKDLLQLGPSILPLIREGLTSKDEEIRNRCEKLIPLVVKLEWGKRVEGYVNDLKEEKKHDFPFREFFEKVVGRDIASRKLFAEAIKANGSFLESVYLQKDAKQGLQLYQDRCRELFSSLKIETEKPLPAELGDIVALLIVSLHFKVDESKWKESNNVVHFFGNSTLVKGIQDKDTGLAFRRLFVSWGESRSADDLTALQYYLLFIRENPFPEAVPSVLQIAKDPKANKINNRALAIMILGEIGDEKVQKELRSLWKDTTLLFQDTDKATVLLGDQAIFASLTLLQNKKHSLTYRVQEIPFQYPGRLWKLAKIFSFPTQKDRDKAIEFLTKEFDKK
jgi:hypothetical protein